MNARAFNDLMNCMPTTGNWLQIIKDSKSDEFDEGCGKQGYLQQTNKGNSIGSPGMMYMYPPWQYGSAAQYVPATCSKTRLLVYWKSFTILVSFIDVGD